MVGKASEGSQTANWSSEAVDADVRDSLVALREDVARLADDLARLVQSQHSEDGSVYAIGPTGRDQRVLVLGEAQVLRALGSTT
jgi:hypothetical protein